MKKEIHKKKREIPHLGWVALADLGLLILTLLVTAQITKIDNEKAHLLIAHTPGWTEPLSITVRLGTFNEQKMFDLTGTLGGLDGQLHILKMGIDGKNTYFNAEIIAKDQLIIPVSGGDQNNSSTNQP